ncbi:hypothetical protein GDO78_022368 [Eleutherodactylus coqui]|uniref:Uncharacterized protein n=1 Tax=Eleutherodactylus coqui TaxID=57060 RepID=A0A8J6EG99_ELECQ|nr:hypothetical protein GDO78_022368 [Eleutherodactylus coqui]
MEAHKAYIRGILIKMSAQHKKIKQAQVNDLLTQMQLQEKTLQSHPTVDGRTTLMSLRRELKTILLEEYNKSTSFMQANYYSSFNEP